MYDPEDTTYSDLLTELQNFEQAIEQQQIEGIEEWKDKVQTILKGAYRIRFGRLRFYDEEPAISEEVPF